MNKTLSGCLCIFLLLFTFQQTFSQLVAPPQEEKNDTVTTMPNGDRVLTKVEIEASFPGGDRAWVKYVTNAMNNANLDRFRNADQGTCRIRFIVDKKGNISNVLAMNMKKTRLAKLAIEIIENGPRWNPAQQGGRFVNAYREQPITFNFEKENK